MAACIALLCGCGQKGPLTLPEDTNSTTTSP
ncbi:MAG: lipoprotein [Cellvibrionaceae bacterium]